MHEHQMVKQTLVMKMYKEQPFQNHETKLWESGKINDLVTLWD